MILLDTHVWIWLNAAPESLSERILLHLTEHELLVSAISIWEAALLIERGRILSNANPDATVRAWLGANPFRVVEINSEIALLSRTLAFTHQDPADRFIGATAYHLGVPLATEDDRLRDLAWLTTL